MEQTVLLEHRSDRSVVPTMNYTPLDADGAVVPGVEVSSIFGSDRGQLIVGPAGEIDVLMFEGDRASEVVNARGVALEVVELDVATELLLSRPQAISNGTEVSKFEAFDEVRLSNETSVDADLRVVCILWNSPEPGHAQQAERVDTVIDTVTIRAGQSVVVPVSDAFLERTELFGFGCDSLKAHLTHSR